LVGPQITPRSRFENRFGSRNYAAEELIAELGAAFLCAEFGLTADVRNAGYVADWIELLKATSGILLRRAAGHPRPRLSAWLALADPSEIAA